MYDPFAFIRQWGIDEGQQLNRIATSNMALHVPEDEMQWHRLR